MRIKLLRSINKRTSLFRPMFSKLVNINGGTFIIDRDNLHTSFGYRIYWVLQNNKCTSYERKTIMIPPQLTKEIIASSITQCINIRYVKINMTAHKSNIRIVHESENLLRDFINMVMGSHVKMLNPPYLLIESRIAIITYGYAREIPCADFSILIQFG